MSLRSLLSAANHKVLSSLCRRTVSLGDRGPIVSFGFDDFPRTAYSVGGRVLESFGARGTYYVAPALMHSDGPLGEICNADDILKLLEKGHELGTQTLHHLSARAVSPAYFREDVEKGIQEAERIAGRKVRNFSYPFGHATLGTKKALDPVVSTARGIRPGTNGPEVDLNLLRANRLYGNVAGSAAVRELIEQNLRQRGWLVFYTHDIRPAPSVYGCTSELFEFAVSEAHRTGNRILTVGEVLNEIQNGTVPQPVEVKETPAAIVR